MFDAYTVGVKVALEDKVSPGLLGMSAKLKAVDAEANKLKNTLKSFAGLAMVGAGFFGLDMIKKTLPDAKAYAHQLNIMNIAGLKHKEIAIAIKDAWKTTSTILTSNPTANLKTILDLRNILGKDNLTPLQSTTLAGKELPMMAMLSAVLNASTEGHGKISQTQMAFSLAKALDIRGATMDLKEFNKESLMMGKVVEATQGRVTPQDYQMLMKYSSQAATGLSNKFLYEELPTFMLQMKTAGGGGGGMQGGMGTALAAFYRFFVQGIMPKKAMMGMESLGLIPKGAGLKTTTTGSALIHGHVQNQALAITDPFQWVATTLLPAIRKKYGNNLTPGEISAVIAQNMSGASAKAIWGTQQFAIKQQQVWRDMRLVGLAMNPQDAYTMSLARDPNTVNTALAAQWQKLKIQIGMVFVPMLLPFLMKLTHFLNSLSDFMQAHPVLFASLVKGFTGLSVALIAIGAALSASAIASLIAAGGTIGIIIGAVTVAIYGLYKAFSELASINFSELIKEFETIGAFFKHLLGFGHQTQAETSFIKAHVDQPSPLSFLINMDGQKVAQIVTNHQANQAVKQPRHGSFTDPTSSLISGMLNPFGGSQ